MLKEYKLCTEPLDVSSWHSRMEEPTKPHYALCISAFLFVTHKQIESLITVRWRTAFINHPILTYPLGAITFFHLIEAEKHTWRNSSGLHRPPPLFIHTKATSDELVSCSDLRPQTYLQKRPPVKEYMLDPAGGLGGYSTSVKPFHLNVY
jgi:hypothetical protein